MFSVLVFNMPLSQLLAIILVLAVLFLVVRYSIVGIKKLILFIKIKRLAKKNKNNKESE